LFATRKKKMQVHETGGEARGQKASKFPGQTGTNLLQFFKNSAHTCREIHAGAKKKKKKGGANFLFRPVDVGVTENRIGMQGKGT